MDAFKQMRPPSPPPPPVVTSQATSEEREDSAGGKEETGSAQSTTALNLNECVTKLLDERMSELETRLQDYVDSKIADLQAQLISKLDNLSQRLDALHQPEGSSNKQQCHITNGTPLSLPLSEDQQLD